MEVNQIAAMHRNISLGKRLVSEHPEIADMYRRGHTYTEIVRTLGLSENYGVNDSIAERAVGSALRGYSGRKGYGGYSGLISRNELEELLINHKKRCGEKVRDERKGVHSLTKDEIREATYKGMKSLGHTPWNREEETFIIYLSLISEYQHLSGAHKGSPDYHKIADRLNNTYHYRTNIRTPLAVLRKAKRLSKLFTASSQCRKG
ncbi:hypothetical protein HYW74_00380 [Candidatus Pacearchaeota archaeon]|nr:hypothetical protein [Candidatus Pacearchaeota archaeon]